MKKIKMLKTLLIPTFGITVIGSIAAISTSCSPVVLVTGVSLDKESLKLEIGSFDTLIATIHPENAADKSTTWSSSNSSVASVDNNGNVAGVGEGSAKITVTTNDGGFTATCQVTVRQKTPVTGVSLDKESLTLEIDDSDTLIATVLPDDASDKSVTWSSSNSSVATVDNNGKVTAVKEGQATITVTTNDCGYKDDCDVTVTYTTAFYICITANTDSTFDLTNEGGNNPNLRYSTDGKNWTEYSKTLNIPTYKRIFLIGDNANGWSQNVQTFSHFNITGNVSISGNVMSLLDNGTGAISSIPNDYCFYGLFYGSTGITSVSENFLPATGLTEDCYDNMFLNCSSLTVAPDLPATTLAEYCYFGMFADCTSLTTAPGLPATKLAWGCYSSMFEYCTSLTTAPDLPATTLAEACYSGMFANCTSITNAPTLPATTLASKCYQFMFSGCTHLASVRIGYTGTVADAPAEAFGGWVVNGCAQTGKFYYKGSDTLANFGFPSGWFINPN